MIWCVWHKEVSDNHGKDNTMKYPSMKCAIWLMQSLFAATAFGWIGNSANDAVYSAANGYVQLEGEDNSTTNSWTGGYKWHGGVVPDGTTDFYVPHSGKSIFMTRASSEAAAVPFAGRTLVVASQIYYTGASGQWGNLGDNVTMLGGSRFFWGSVGNITGTSLAFDNCSETWPVYFMNQSRTGYRYTVNMNVPVKADSDACLIWRMSGAGDVGVTFDIGKSWPEFYGTATLLSNNIYRASTFSMPGRLRLSGETVFALTGASGTSVFGGLFVDSGSNFRLTSGNNTQIVSVTGKLDFAEGAIVRGGKFTRWDNGTPPTKQVFSLSPEAVTAGLPDMSKVKYDLYDCANGIYFADFPNVSWTESPRGDGGVYLGVTYNEIVSITNNMLDAATPFNEDGNAANAPSKFLSDGRAFHNGVDYYASNKNLILLAVSYPYIFPGDSLVLDSQSSMGFHGSFSCSNLVLIKNGHFRMMDWAKTYVLDGSMKLCKNPTTAATSVLPAWRFQVGDRGTYKVESSLSGDGDIVVRLVPRGTDSRINWRGYMELLGDNSGYTGRIMLDAGRAGDFSDANAFKNGDPYSPGPVSNVTLTVHRQANLGGALAKFTPDALCVSNECRVVLADTALFDEPTRGWCFVENGYLKVNSGAMATVKNTITYGTRLVKEGTGTLVLGSKPLRLDDGVRPTLVVQEGGLGVAATNALAGLDVTFAADTSFVVATGQGDDAVRAKGAVLTDTGITAPDGIAVTFDVAPTLENTLDVAIATVNAGDAEDFAAKLKIGHVARSRVAARRVTNEDGTITFMARITPSGLTITFK